MARATAPSDPTAGHKLVLDRNPENFFAQIEQAAFEPSALVPGIGIAPDKMLLGRMFAYADTRCCLIHPISTDPL